MRLHPGWRGEVHRQHVLDLLLRMVNTVSRICAALLLLTAVAAHAHTVSVSLKNGETAQARLQRLDAEAPARDVVLPAEISLGEGTWELRVISPEYWAAPVTISDSRPVAIALWPRGEIAGTLAKRAPSAAQLWVTFRAKDLEGRSLCEVDELRWRCAVPAENLDLQFALAGSAPEFRWGVDARKPARVGALAFTPGSSLSGHLQLQKGVRQKLGGIEVSIAPANHDARRVSTTADAKGFFQLKGVAAGSYVVRAAGNGLVSPPRTVEVIAGVNATLRAPLDVAPPRKASLTFHPPLDVAGERWLAELVTTAPGSTTSDVVAQSLASPSGQWTSTALTPGEYQLVVRRQDKGLWKTQNITVAEEDVELAVSVEGQRVEGTVRVGDRPLEAATVQFGGDWAEEFVADDEGRFQGVVPQADDNVARILVTADAPDVRRHVRVEGSRSLDGDMTYDVVLPDTTILGRTIDQNGKPVPYAILTLRSVDDRELLEQPSSHEDGSFQLAGYAPGTYRLQAAAFEMSSAVVDVHASESVSPQTIDVVLRSPERVLGEVMMGSLPIAGAEIVALPHGVATSFVPIARSDARGRFTLDLPPGTATYDVIAISPGFATAAGRVTRDAKKILHVEAAQHGGSLVVSAPAEGDLRLMRDGGDFPLTWLAWKTHGVVETTDGGRRITLANMEPGPYRVCTGPKCATTYVPRLGEVSVSLTD
jgi:hypothetical protein